MTEFARSISWPDVVKATKSGSVGSLYRLLYGRILYIAPEPLRLCNVIFLRVLFFASSDFVLTISVKVTDSRVVSRVHGDLNSTQSYSVLTRPMYFYYTAFIHCTLASGAVYCDRCCLSVCLCVCGVRAVSVTTITRNCVHRFSSPNWVCE